MKTPTMLRMAQSCRCTPSLKRYQEGRQRSHIRIRHHGTSPGLATWNSSPTWPTNQKTTQSKWFTTRVLKSLADNKAHTSQQTISNKLRRRRGETIPSFLWSENRVIMPSATNITSTSAECTENLTMMLALWDSKRAQRSPGSSAIKFMRLWVASRSPFRMVALALSNL